MVASIQESSVLVVTTPSFSLSSNGYPSAVTDQSLVTHGTFFYIANEEGLIANTSIHVGIRGKFQSIDGIGDDESMGFYFITTDDIDDYGVVSFVERIRKRVGDTPVYLSLDIDILAWHPVMSFRSSRTRSKALSRIAPGAPEAG
ncbi:hypothetical protein OG21DRAFT_33842 [Imleria badia]|nr:hypothetical protein OG21DRAFT_33842 [Imleria badia]